MSQIKIWTDGACSGNPGPGGWGVLLRSGTHEKHLKGGLPETTNNRMELMAAIEALKSLKYPCTIDLYTDSAYVKGGITSWIHSWKRNGWKTVKKNPVKNVDLWQELDGLIQIHQINWYWVKGHAGHVENERADSLAREGMSCFKKTSESSL